MKVTKNEGGSGASPVNVGGITQHGYEENQVEEKSSIIGGGGSNIGTQD